MNHRFLSPLSAFHSSIHLSLSLLPPSCSFTPLPHYMLHNDISSYHTPHTHTLSSAHSPTTTHSSCLCQCPSHYIEESVGCDSVPPFPARTPPALTQLGDTVLKVWSSFQERYEDICGVCVCVYMYVCVCVCKCMQLRYNLP